MTPVFWRWNRNIAAKAINVLVEQNYRPRQQVPAPP